MRDKNTVRCLPTPPTSTTKRNLFSPCVDNNNTKNAPKSQSVSLLVTFAGTGFHLAVGFVSAVEAPPPPPPVAVVFLIAAAAAAFVVAEVASVPGAGPAFAAELVDVDTGTAAFTSGCGSLPAATLTLSAADDVEPVAEFFAIASNGSVALAALEVLLLLGPFALLLLLVLLGLPVMFAIEGAAAGTVFTWK